jgi:deoxyribonuclease V
VLHAGAWIFYARRAIFLKNSKESGIPFSELFSVPATLAEARARQEALRGRLRLEDDIGQVRLIAGVDVGYDVAQNMAHASIVTLSAEDLTVHEKVKAVAPADFPYITGLLAFREIPAILAALHRLGEMPDLLMVDGQGIAHPRRMGIAAHLGVLLDMPSIGVAKSRLTGTFDMPNAAKGSRSPLMAGKERIGTVLRSRDHVRPLFVSPGHRVSIETAEALTLRCLTRYRLPEPTRLADKYSKLKSGLAKNH